MATTELFDFLAVMLALVRRYWTVVSTVACEIRFENVNRKDVISIFVQRTHEIPGGCRWFCV